MDNDGPFPIRAFDSFNARFLTSEEVANSFIAPEQYWRLIETNHSVILGPRGSGKTTLLKMLQLRSLAVWNHERAPEVRKALGYHAIFLGTDVLWGSQLEARTEAVSDVGKRTQIRRTSFRLHLALAFLNAIEEGRDSRVKQQVELSRFFIDLNRDDEAIVAKALAKTWALVLDSESLLGVRIALRGQLSSLLQLVSHISERQDLSLPAFVHLDPVASIVDAVDVVNAVLEQPERRWCLLCDELEIAPDMIRKELFQLLRSTSHALLFKFSLFPYSSELAEVHGPSAPTANNDYAPIELSYGRRESAYSFCEDLFHGMVLQAGGKLTTRPEEALGDGWFDGGRSHRRLRVSPYAPPQGEFYRRATSLAHVDPSFVRFLKRNHFDLKHVHELDESTQAPFRKALPFILTRSEFLKSGRIRRSRKATRLYTGTFSMFSLTEGNPRIFINLMRPLVAEYVAKGGTVGVDQQVSSQEVTIHRFRASLSAIPSSAGGTAKSVLELVEIVGRFFENATLDEDFAAEPPTTFTLDDNVSREDFEIVGRALNAGAFVLMPDDVREGVSELKNARLRLAYTLAPQYKLPLVAGRSISLSTILGAHRNAKRRQPDYSPQARLPFGLDE